MSLNDLHIGKTISLAEASKLLAEKDNGYLDLKWTLRYCLESFIKVGIKIPIDTLVWERDKCNYKDNSCGKCHEIIKQIDELREQDIYEDEKLPSLCADCHMTSPPMMGKGDYIRYRNGFFFIYRDDIGQLIKSNSIDISRFYVIDDTKNVEGDLLDFKSFEIASEKEWIEWDIKRAFYNTDDYSDLYENLTNGANTIDYLTVTLDKIHCWKEDIEKTLTGGKLVDSQPQGYGKRDKQIKVLLAVLVAMEIAPLAIPEKAKTEIHQACFISNKYLFTPNRDTFDGIWKDAKKQGWIRTIP